MRDAKNRSDRAPVYTTTLLGNLVYSKCVLEIEKMLSKGNTLKAAEVLYHSSRFSPEEILQFMIRYM